MNQGGVASCSSLLKDATARRHQCILWVYREWGSGFPEFHCCSFQVSQDMASGTNHPSEAFSKMASGIQGRVVERRTRKLVREAEKPVTVSTRCDRA